MATYNSKVSAEGRYLRLTVAEVDKSPGTNTSKIKWKLETLGGAVLYYDTYCVIKINGTTVFYSNGPGNNHGAKVGYLVWENNWVDNNGNTYTCAVKGYTKSGTTKAIKHGSDGKKSITIEFTVGFGIPSYANIGTVTKTFTLSNLDTTAPICEQYAIRELNPSSGTATAQAIATSNCNYAWRIKAGNGSWTNWSADGITIVAATSSSVTIKRSINNMNPDTVYQFQFRATKTSNNKTTESNIQSVSYKGASVINSVNNIVLNDNPFFTFKFTSKDSNYLHKITLPLGTNYTKELGRFSAGSNSVTISDNTFITKLKSFMSNKTSANINAILDTYYQNYSSKVGNSSTKTVNIQVDTNLAKPTLTASYINPDTQDLVIIPDVSTIDITAIVQTKFGADIGTLTAKIGSRTIDLNKNGSPTSWGIVTTSQLEGSGNKLVVTVVDTRGLSSTATLDLYIGEDSTPIKLYASDFQYWYDTLDEIYSGKNPQGSYYISGTTSKNFNVTYVEQGDKAILSPILSTTKGICGAVSALPHSSSSDYYYPVRNEINNIVALSRWIYIIEHNLYLASKTNDSPTPGTITYNGSDKSLVFTNGSTTRFEVDDLSFYISDGGELQQRGEKILKELKRTLDVNMNVIDRVKIFNFHNIINSTTSPITTEERVFVVNTTIYPTWRSLINDSSSPIHVLGSWEISTSNRVTRMGFPVTIKDGESYVEISADDVLIRNAYYGMAMGY